MGKGSARTEKTGMLNGDSSEEAGKFSGTWVNRGLTRITGLQGIKDRTDYCNSPCNPVIRVNP